MIGAPVCHAADAAGTLASLRAYFAETRDLSARFTQTTMLKAVEMEQTASGTVAFKKGGKMRWRYEGEDPQEIVSDGVSLWIHQVRDRTAIRREVARLSPAARLALDLLGGLDHVDRYFDASSCGGDCVELTPKKGDPDLKRVRVEAAAGGRDVRAVVTVDPLDNVTRVEFSEVRRNTGLSDDSFAFRPPEGVEVLEETGRAP
jgi:chaperone LolA